MRAPYYSATYTRQTLTKIKTLIETSSRQEEEAIKVILLLTDGDPNPSTELAVANNVANQLKQSGVAIMTIGVGGGIKEDNLLAWAMKPEYAIKTGFKDLAAKVAEIKASLCKGKFNYTKL